MDAEFIRTATEEPLRVSWFGESEQMQLTTRLQIIISSPIGRAPDQDALTLQEQQRSFSPAQGFQLLEAIRAISLDAELRSVQSQRARTPTFHQPLLLG